MPGGSRIGLATLAVDLRVEEEIGREAATGRGIDAPHAVTKDERGHRRPAILVSNVDNQRHGRVALKEDVEVAAKTEVLGSLADVEADSRLALAGIAAVDLDDAVFEARGPERDRLSGRSLYMTTSAQR